MVDDNDIGSPFPETLHVDLTTYAPGELVIFTPEMLDAFYDHVGGNASQKVFDEAVLRYALPRVMSVAVCTMPDPDEPEVIV